MDEQQIVFFDIETGGLDIARHPIIQLGAYVRETGEEFQRLVQFEEAAADPAALKMNHYNRERWEAEAVSPLQAAVEFSFFCRRHATMRKYPSGWASPQRPVTTLAGHNAIEFDLPFLRRWAGELTGVRLPIARRALCTLQLAQWLHPGLPSYSLTALCKRFGVRQGKAHDALADAKASAALADALLGAAQDRGLV